MNTGDITTQYNEYVTKTYNVEEFQNQELFISGRQGGASDGLAIACIYSSDTVFDSTTCIKSFVFTPDRTDYPISNDILTSIIIIPSATKTLKVCANSSSKIKAASITRQLIIEEKEEHLPDYWLTHLNTKIGTILTNIKNADILSDYFIFCTDIHYPEYSFGVSPYVMDYITRKTPIQNIILGGDLIQTTTNALEKYNEYRGLMNYYQRVFAIRGNHDDGNMTFYPAWWSPLDNIMERGTTEYYYKDNTSKKIRYIFMNGKNPDSGSFNSAEISWAEDKITELESGWSVLIFTHGLWIANTPSYNELQKCADYTTLTNMIDDIYDTCNARIIGIVCGHCHRDYSEVRLKGYVLIATTCDSNGVLASYDPITPSRVRGTITEAAVDVFVVDTVNRVIKITRIGAGGDNDSNNRQFSF